MPLYFGFTAQAGRQRVPPSDGHIAAQHVLLHVTPPQWTCTCTWCQLAHARLMIGIVAHGAWLRPIRKMSKHWPGTVWGPLR